MPVGGYGWRRTVYETFGWKPWDVMRVLNEYPQEARLLGIDFEETAGYQAERLAAQERDAQRSGYGSSFSSSSGSNVSTNVPGAGVFESEETVGGDDEVDWKEATRLEEEFGVSFE